MQASRLRSPWPGRLPLVLPVLMAMACSPPPASDGQCWTLARVPGPEDLVLVPGEDAVLVSSQDRRADPQPEGAIWYVPLDPAEPAMRARRLTLRGRQDECSFHPHGIDLVEVHGGRLLLYVVNHHDPEDLLPHRGCLDAILRTSPRARVASVEVYELRNGEIFFLQRLADPTVLTHANDLVARPNGDVWVTNPPPGTVEQLADLVQTRDLWGLERSRVVRFECRSRADDGRCDGAWFDVELPFDPPLRYANGIEIREVGGERPTLYVASTGGHSIHRAFLDDRATLAADGVIGLGAMPDNLIWMDDAGGDLLVAAHPKRRRFTQHARSPATPSPSWVYRVDVTRPDGPEKPWFEDSGGRVSAASAAAWVGGRDLVLAQVFEPTVQRCRMESSRGEIP